jgi:CPA1 family monovalent cation:H+ antiporter
MQADLPVLIAILSVLAVVSLAAPRLRIPAPVLLALAGMALAFIPSLPRVPLHPDLILFLFLPPILYADAFGTSWTDFRRWLRPILMLAVGLVAATILVVGLVAHALLPELPWPACFILGAIVSPTDTVAIHAVIERLRVPRRITAILGGESLVNDATGLVGVQLGVAVALSGAFELSHVAMNFAWVAGGGVVIGATFGAVFSAANRWVRGTPVLFVLSLLSPYLAFVVAHHLGASGVLAVVVAGFVVAWRIHQVTPQARIDLYATWNLIVFVLNGMCFVFIGLETPHLFLALDADHRRALVIAGLGVSLAVILVRIAWIFPGAYLPLFLLRAARVREGGYPPWQSVTVASWCGVRGVVSLAAALALPATLPDGSPFPGREAILICTLMVISVTLLVQGPTLLPLIRLLGIRDEESSAGEIHQAREEILSAGIARLDEYCSQTSCPISVHHFRTLMFDELEALRDQDVEQKERAGIRLAVSQEVRREVTAAQRTALLALRDKGAINDQSYLALQLELDRVNVFLDPAGE